MKLKYCLPALLWPVANLCAQATLSGVVHTKTNIPLVNVSIGLRESGTHTISSATGVFALTLRKPQDTLIVSAVGYQLYKLPVSEQTGFLDIALEERTESLDEVVVIGYGTTTKRYSTGSVATVSGTELAKQPVANPLAALEGRMPGLSVTQSNGVPGSSFAVQVRGQSSLLQGSDPLFVIDGVPYAPNNGAVNNLSSAAASFGSGLSPFSSLNPADIESITVLKDADATAIYGSRGANGVVLITTKKGKSGKTELAVNAYGGWSEVGKRTELLRTPEYLRARQEALKNDGVVADAQNAPDLVVWDTTRYTDFEKLLVGGKAWSDDVQASLTGGGGGTQFLMSGGYHRETTVFQGDLTDKRGSLHASVNHTSPDRKLVVGLSVLYSSERNEIPGTDVSSQTRLAPNTPALKDSAGGLVWSSGGVPINNPLAYLLQMYRAVTDNLLGNLSVSYRVLPHLMVKGSAGYNTYTLNEVNVNPITSQDPQYNPQGYSQFGTTTLRSWILEPQSEYSNQWKDWRLTVLAGGTVQENKNRNSSLFAYGYSNDQLLESESAAASLAVLGDNATQYRYGAVFGRVTGSLKNTYILNLSGRRDGSSRFGPGKQWANFGAAGAAWVFSNESWIKKGLKLVSLGKLRASYGVTGNDQIGDYNYLNTWSPVAYPYNGVAGLYPTRLFNPLYSWETNRKAELGLDAGLWKDRLTLTADYFRNRSSNQLVNYTLPSQTGFTSILSNLPATVQNSGWEVSVASENIARTSFGWTTTLTLTVPKNKLVAFPGLASSAYADRYETGKPVTIVKGFHSTGVDPQTGVFAFDDVNKDGVFDRNDLSVIADVAPKYYGGLLNSFRAGGWSLDVFLQYKKQTGLNELYSLYSPYVPPPGGMLNAPVSVLSRWRQPGDVSGYQRFTTTQGTEAYHALNYANLSSLVYSDASFIRLKNVALSFALPERMLRRTGIGSLRVYAQGQNLLTITHYNGQDPETQNFLALPPLRTVTGGMQVTF